MSIWLICIAIYFGAVWLVALIMMLYDGITNKSSVKDAEWGLFFLLPFFPLLLLLLCVSLPVQKITGKSIGEHIHDYKEKHRVRKTYGWPIQLGEDKGETWTFREPVKENVFKGKISEHFDFKEKSVYYISLSPHPIEEHLYEYFGDIDFLLRDKNRRFIYFPKEIEKISNDEIGYLTGSLQSVVSQHDIFNSILTEDFKSQLDGPCFLRVYEDYDEKVWYARFTNITDCDCEDFEEIVLRCTYTLTNIDFLVTDGSGIEKKVEEYDILFRSGDDEEIDAEEAFQEEIERLNAENELPFEDRQALEEIRCNIKKLLSHGVNLDIIRTLFQVNVEKSRLKISSDNRIFLVDYDNTEIIMPNLAKAVFFLYLKHPEGIALKMMPDYEEELFRIYKGLGEWNLIRIRATIHNLVDPSTNRMNEQLSKIRRYFLAKIDEGIATPYIITGERGEARKISLDRKLVIWE